MIRVLVYRSRIVVTLTVEGKKVVYMATAAQIYNTAVVAASVTLAAGAPGMTPHRRGMLMIASIAGGLLGGAVIGTVVANVLVSSGICLLGDANTVCLAYKAMQHLLLLTWLFVSSPYASRMKRSGITNPSCGGMLW